MKPTRENPVDWQNVLSGQQRWLSTVLLARGVEPSAVEEVLQEVSMAAAKGASQLRDPGRVAPWLYRIAVTSALQHRRRQGRRRKLERRYAEQFRDPKGEQPDPLDWLLAKEQQQLVRQAISHLPSRDAEILLLKYTEEWTYRELAEHVGVSTSAVEARLHRAREKMRRALAAVAPNHFLRQP